MINFTTVVGIDERHLPELKLTWPTWQRHRPEILAHPLLLICDASRTRREWLSKLSFIEHPDRRLVLWDQPGVSQREKMLTGLTMLPGREVSTDWYLKLDTDVVATGPAKWLQDDWFQQDERGRLPAFVSSPWGYTKPADAIDRLDDWAARIGAFPDSDPLELHPEEGSDCVPHKRTASWCFFGNTEWTREVTALCGSRLPVPSQDTYLWYCAVRRKDFFRRIRMKGYGWANYARRTRLKAACDTALAQPAEAAGSESAKAAAATSKPRRQAVEAGVVYLLTGPAHAARLVVSIASLREHYRGPVAVFTTHRESHEIGIQIAADHRLDVDHYRFHRSYRRKNASFLMKLDLMQDPPFGRSLYLDADTVVVGDISSLFEFPENYPFIATQFADWTSRRSVIRSRIERWRPLSQEEFLGISWDSLLDAALDGHPAVNSGVFAVRRRAEFVRIWHELALIGRRTFICEEVALQLLLHRFPHRLLDCRWNCSPIYGKRTDDVRIWHMHGEKHLRSEARTIWWPRYLDVVQKNFAEISDWTPASDRRLRSFLKQQDSVPSSG